MVNFSPNGEPNMMEVCVLGSGSAGNAILLRGGGVSILVDAGLSARQLRARLTTVGTRPEELDAILLTHEHSDHTGALKVLCKGLHIPVFANRLTADGLRFGQGYVPSALRLFSTGSEFRIGGLVISSFSVPHDAADPVGFVVACGEARFAVLTDLGQVTRSVVSYVSGVHGLFVETNYEEELLESDTKRPWPVKQRISSRHGHLSNAAAADLVAGIASANLRAVILGHLSRDCNTPERARETVARRLSDGGWHGVEVHCAAQEIPSPPFRFFH